MGNPEDTKLLKNSKTDTGARKVYRKGLLFAKSPCSFDINGMTCTELLLKFANFGD